MPPEERRRRYRTGASATSRCRVCGEMAIDVFTRQWHLLNIGFELLKNRQETWGASLSEVGFYAPLSFLEQLKTAQGGWNFVTFHSANLGNFMETWRSYLEQGRIHILVIWKALVGKCAEVQYRWKSSTPQTSVTRTPIFGQFEICMKQIREISNTKYLSRSVTWYL